MIGASYTLSAGFMGPPKKPFIADTAESTLDKDTPLLFLIVLILKKAP